MKELFPDGEDKPPRLKKEYDQAWTLNDLANSYSLSGNPEKAVPLFLKTIEINENENNMINVATSLGNVAHMAQIQIGKLSAASIHLRKSTALTLEIKDELMESLFHNELGRVLAYQGNSYIAKVLNLRKINSTTAEDELDKSTAYFEKEKYYQGLSVNFAYRSLSALLQSRLAEVLPVKRKNSLDLSLQAMEQAHKSLEFAKKKAKVSQPNQRDFIRAYHLLGESSIQRKISNKPLGNKEFEIHFYDENFQKQKEPAIIKDGNELEIAERCLNEALRRCRNVNLVELEPDILLGLARLEWAKMPAEQRDLENIKSIEETLNEAQQIAERAGYRLKLADIHLFCAEVLMQVHERASVEVPKSQTMEDADKKLLRHSAQEHLQKVKEYAKDDSEFSDLYQSKDKHFYDGIPGYEMLKRGMTEEERILNGYWIAYKIAETLEERLKS